MFLVVFRICNTVFEKIHAVSYSYTDQNKNETKRSYDLYIL
jgi:hypothetical protein